LQPASSVQQQMMQQQQMSSQTLFTVIFPCFKIMGTSKYPKSKGLRLKQKQRLLRK
jgi:hypothetical protein